MWPHRIVVPPPPLNEHLGLQECVELLRAVGAQELGLIVKNEKFSDALHTGRGARILLQWATSEPGVVPGNFKWEIPDNGFSTDHLAPHPLDQLIHS